MQECLIFSDDMSCVRILKHLKATQLKTIVEQTSVKKVKCQSGIIKQIVELQVTMNAYP